MDNVNIVWAVMLLGAIMGTLVPYIMKVIKDPALTFDYNYAYSLFIGIIVQSIALVPDSVPALTIKVIVSAFAAGAGIQMILNKAVPRASS